MMVVCIYVPAECDRGVAKSLMRFLLRLLSCREGGMSNKIGSERGEKHRFNVTFMLFFRFCSRKCLIISHYIAIYWIFLRIFARIFKGRSIFRYLAENDHSGWQEGGGEK